MNNKFDFVNFSRLYKEEYTKIMAVTKYLNKSGISEEKVIDNIFSIIEGKTQDDTILIKYRVELVISKLIYKHYTKH